jgi:hypothetical protein
LICPVALWQFDGLDAERTLILKVRTDIFNDPEEFFLNIIHGLSVVIFEP